MSNFENDNDFLAGLKAEFEPAGNKSGNDFLAGLKDEFEPKKPQGGIWETTKAFGRDLAKVPSEISSGFGTTTDQMRMFANFVQGDREELESLYNGLKNYTPLPESETTVGGWVRGAANTLPYMGMSATAGVGGGSIGGALGSVVPYVGTAVGRRAGAALGSASVGFAQGWGEMYGRLRDEGIDHDTAAGIAFAVAPVYAGIEAVQVRKIPGAAQLADKYLGSTFKKILAEKFADKALRNKVAKALGSYAGEIISQSAEEGAQEMAMNTGEQYARNDGFKNFDIGENLSAGAEAFKESVGPFTVMQAGNIPINAILNRRAKRLQKDLENVKNAVEEGKGTMKGGVSVPPNTPLGGIFVADKKFYRNVDGVAVPLKKEEIVKIRANESETDNLDADAESDPYGKPDTKPEESNTDLDAAKDESAKLQVPYATQESAPAQNAGERAARIFMENVQNDPLNVPQGIPPNVDMSLARFVQMQRQLREAQARKAEEEAKRLESDRKAEEAMFDAQAEADFEAAKRKTAEKLSKLANKTNRVAARIDKIKDPAARLNAIKSAVDEGDIEKLSDGHLEFAWENGEQWAERELFRRQEAANSGTPLLEVMKENGFKLPTPAAIKRHAQEHGRGLSGYLFGEINDLYNSLPTNQRLKYFTKNYVNLDETAESLKQFGFNYDSEGEFISDVASNLSGQKYSYGFSLAENDYANMSNAELVEAHRKAESAKDFTSGFEIRKEWDRRKGYRTDIHHGTGADGFNVAKADASKAKNGEGAQAHGMGLYGAGNKEVAKEYWKSAVYAKPYYTYWAKGEELSKGAKELGIRDVYFNNAMSKIADIGFARMKKDIEKEINSYAKGIEELDRRIIHWREKARKSKTKYYDYMSQVESYSYEARKKEEYKQEAEGKLKLYQLVNDWLASKGISEKEIEKRGRSDGKLFNWRTNLTKENTLDEQLPFSKQNAEVKKKLRKLFKDNGKDLAELMRTGYVKGNPTGGEIYGEVQSVLAHGSAAEASRLLTKYGIRGITYDGRRDGRCYVLFEGGSAVKLQDAFTYDDDGKYIPLDKRSDVNNPDMRYSIGEDDAQKTKQAKIDEIKTVVEEVRGKFNRRAKIKSDVSVVGTLEDARGVLGAESIPYNARAVQDKEKIVIIAENIADSDEAVRIFLHEQVGHWGLRKLLKADLKPFLNYIIAHYQDSDAWKRVSKYYRDVAKNKYAIAEEVLAHVAENRELSDPSMWKRLVHRVKRELWGNGVPQEYVNLLNEDVLRSAIALSREWAKGDHYLNADGIWAKIESAPKGRDVPDESDDGKRFSLVGEKGVSRLKNGLARDLLNEAVEMEKSGVDADKIWQETGWERNTVDGKWRFEIPYGFLKRDPRFKSPTRGVNAFEFPTEQTYSTKRKYKLADIWNAPILFEAYPELADMPVKFNANSRSLTRGSASKEDGLTINLKDTDLLFGNPIWVKESEIKQIIQHEIEHAIQDIEGFSEGSTPSTMRRISAFYNNPEGYRKAKEEIAAAKKPFTDFCLSLGWDGEGRMPKAFKEKLANDRTLANKYMTLVNTYNTTYRNASKYYTMPSEKFGYEQYRRVGGEVEARNAARRLEMSDDERKAKRPSLTADVEPSSQIYLGDSNIDSLNFHDFKTGEKYNAAETRFSLREEDEAGARAIRKELPNFIQSMMEIKEGLDENWASFVGKDFSADLIKKIVSFNIDKDQPTNLYEYNEKERNSSRSSQPSPSGEGIVPDKLRRDIRGSVGSWQQGMGQKASDTLLEEFRRLSRAQERMGEEQKIATRADAIKWIRKNVAQGAFFKNHPNLHIEDLFEYKAGSKFSGSKTVEALLEDSEQYGALSVFDRIRIAAVLQRRELKNEYKPVFGGKESLENDKTGGVFVPKNEKVAESQILAADTIRGCDNDCYDCYANKLSKISTISFTHKVPMTLDNVKIKEGQVIRLGTSGDPASNWTHSRNEMIKLFERAWKGSTWVKPQDVSFEKNSFVITKLQSIQGYDPKVFPNLEVSLDPFYPEDMFLAMKNLTVLMAMCPEVNVVARIRSYNSFDKNLKQSLDSALQFCKDHNLRVLETRMRFESKTAYSLLGLVEDDYQNKMSASGEKELAQVVGKVRFLPNFYTEEEKSRLLFCGENGELGCGACQNCVNTQVYSREQSGRNSPIIAQSLDRKQNDAYEGVSDSDMPMYSLKEETPETDKEYKQKRAREEIQSKAGRAVQAAVDAFAPLAALERVLYGGVRGAEKSAWKMALMTRNLDQVMFHVLRVGGIKYNKADGSFVKREGTKGLEEILKPVKGENYKNFEHYAKAKSAIERWGFLRKTNSFAGKNFYDTFGFSLEYAKKWVAEGSGASKKAFDELQTFFQGQRDFMLETGLITPEQHAALSLFKNYVPFFREGADLDAETEAAYERFSEIFPAGKGFSGRKSGVEKFEGSARRTKNLVENIVNQSRKVIDSGYKNIAAYRSLNLMRELDMAKYVHSDSVDAQVKIAEMRRALEAEGIEVGDISDEELLKKVPVEAYLKITDDSNDNIVSVRVNGTLRFYKVEDPELLVAVKNFGAEKVNVMWKLLTAPKNIMTQAITKTPEFAIRNFIRDTGSNTILFGGKTLAPYLAHTVKNAVKSAWNTEDMQKVWAAGAGGGAWYSVKAEDIAADFKDGEKIQKIGKYTIKPLKWLLNEYERRILMPSEQGNRITVMQKALENGASDMEAAFQYLDVMNFGMRGSGVWTGKNEWAKGVFTALHAVVRITPFLNARIQGLYKLWRESGAQDARFKAGEEFALKERTRAFVKSLSKAVLLRGMMMASASMLYSLYANGSTDDDGDKWFEKLPAHDKLNYWHFYLGNNNILRIPKPFEIGYIFGTIPEAITDALIQTRPQTAKVLWAGLTSQLEFDPLSNPVIDTVREQHWNKDSFTKRPIVQQSDKDLKPRYQYDPDTSATAKAVARVFEGVGLDDSWLASPARIQNVIGNFLGGMTKYITAASDVIVESLTNIEGGTSRYARENATKRVYDWAVRNTKTMTTRNAEDYYALRNRVREVYGAARVLRQEKRLEECQNLIDEHKGELGNYDLIEAVNTRLGEISRKRKALGANRTLSTEELIRADDELLAERNKLLADVDILLDRVESGNFNARDMRDILKRIRNADREKKDSKKARSRLRELANMR